MKDGGEGRGGQIDPPPSTPEKSNLKKTSLMRVKSLILRLSVELGEDCNSF